MQPNEIVLDVNDDNDDGTTPTVEVTMTRFDEYQNRSEYISDTHTISVRDKLGLYRTQPKQSGNFRGTAKSAVKFTTDHSVAGVDAATTIIAPAIVEVGFSFPVGMTAAQCLVMRMKAVALLQDDTVMVPLTDQLMV